MSATPLITIAIPTRDRVGLLRETLASALAQDFPGVEIIVSDNASSDGTAAFLAEASDARLRVFRQETVLSMHENWNFCLKQARGKFFLLLSDDDLLLPGALTALLPAFEDETVKLAYSRAMLITHDGKPAGLTLRAPALEAGDNFIRESLQGRRQVLPCITLHYSAELQDLGGYPAIGNVADLAVRLALAAKGKVYCSDVPLAKYRLNPEGLTADAEKTLESLDQFVVWIAKQHGMLSSFRADASAFCARWLRARAVFEALRGREKAAAKFASAVARYNGSFNLVRFLVGFCSLAPVRALASLRRSLMLGNETSACNSPDFGRIVSVSLPPALFFGAWLLTSARVPGGGVYLALLLLSAVYCSAAVNELAPRGIAALPAWFALAIMLCAGFMKFFWIVLDPVAPHLFFPPWVRPYFGQPELLLATCALQTGAFVALCSCLVLAFRLMDLLRMPRPLQAESYPVSDRVALSLTVFLPVLAGLSIWFVKKYQIGVLGLVSEPLPLRLSGVIFYLQTILLPVLILCQIWLAEKSSRSWLARFGLLLLFAWAGADALVRGSRGSLLLAPLLTLFMTLCGGLRIRKTESALIISAVLSALLLAPLAVQYRLLRVEGVPLADTLSRLSAGYSATFPGLLKTAVFFFFRIPGSDMLFALLSMSSEPLGSKAVPVLFSPGGIPDYITRSVFGVKYTMAFAPSFSGSGYVLWGYAGILLFSAVGAAIAVFAWNALLRLRLHLLPVFLTMFMLLFFWLLTEGLTPIVVKQLFSSAVICVLGELLLRVSSRSRA